MCSGTSYTPRAFWYFSDFVFWIFCIFAGIFCMFVSENIALDEVPEHIHTYSEVCINLVTYGPP